MAKIEKYRGRLQNREKARKYATRFERGSRRRIDAREQRAVRAIFAELPGCGRVLDVPSGAGRFQAALGKNGSRVIEADVGWEILEFARHRGGAAGYVQADASRLPVTDGAVDCVFCNRLLHHILPPEERALFFQEFHRVSRRWLVISFFDYHAFGWMRRMLKRVKGRRTKYAAEPTRAQFEAEAAACGWELRRVVATGRVWVAEKYFVLEKRPEKR